MYKKHMAKDFTKAPSIFSENFPREAAGVRVKERNSFELMTLFLKKKQFCLIFCISSV